MVMAACSNKFLHICKQFCNFEQLSHGGYCVNYSSRQPRDVICQLTAGGIPQVINIMFYAQG